MSDNSQPGLALNDPSQEAKQDGPVECLGKTFANDAERREHYLGLLAEKLKDPEFRKIEGFPIGEDEDILELSDPPYYTACPNPFIEEFIAYYGRPYDPAEGYKREPYAVDVSEGKNHPIYMAHSYHTKVPHKAIMHYILHYTEPGDIVFDSFCGSGMTGVAAHMCGQKDSVEEIGYRVLPNGSILKEIEDPSTNKTTWKEISKLGARNVVLNDLSPIAAYISNNYNSPVNGDLFLSEARDALDKIKSDCGWFYQTTHTDGKSVGEVNYTTWSDVFSCPECAGELIFWDVAVDKNDWSVSDAFSCTSCHSSLNKRKLERQWSTFIDDSTGETYRLARQVPVLIHYKVGTTSFVKEPDDEDMRTLQKIEGLEISSNILDTYLPPGDKMGDPEGVGILKARNFYYKRALYCLAKYKDLVSEKSLGHRLLINLTSSAIVLSKQYRFRSQGGSLGAGGGPMNGTLYVPSLVKEIPVVKVLSQHIERMGKVLAQLDTGRAAITTGSAASLSEIPDSSLDYIFIDPPFGANIMYSELSFLWESWLGVSTNNKSEAIENRTQGKGKNEYRGLMSSCLSEAYRVLKPGHWVTVEFSNTRADVWNNIQSAIVDAGFIVSNVSSLDKKQGSFNAVTNATSVKQDLVISAYKPNGGFEDRFVNETGEEGVWDFVRTHLGYLPIVKKYGDEIRKIPERDPRILFDQVVAYFVRRLRDVPVSSKYFQEGLLERFAERDEMIFLPEQVADYDKARISSKQLKQLSIFVDDEASAIEWMRQLLNEKPQSTQDIHPKFINELSGWKKAEEQLELSKLLDQNFLKYGGEGPLPAQIHSYLSTNFKEMRNLSKDDAQLIKKAKDRWYVPNPEREEDLQKLRERDLLKQFEEYKEHSGRKLKTVRMEAVRCGFKKAWQERDYPTIISVAEKIPQNLLQEDQKLLMWYDQAQTRYSDESLF